MQNQPNDTAALLVELRAEMQQLMRQGGDWEAFALKVFRFQCAHNAIYGAYVRLRGVDPEAVASTREVPYLPVPFFQSHWVSVFNEGTSMDRIFESSGTTGQRRSRHPVDDLGWYDEVAMAGFEQCVGAFAGRKIAALLPGYDRVDPHSYGADLHATMQSAISPNGFSWMTGPPWSGNSAPRWRRGMRVGHWRDARIAQMGWKRSWTSLIRR